MTQDKHRVIQKSHTIITTVTFERIDIGTWNLVILSKSKETTLGSPQNFEWTTLKRSKSGTSRSPCVLISLLFSAECHSCTILRLSLLMWQYSWSDMKWIKYKNFVNWMQNSIKEKLLHPRPISKYQLNAIFSLRMPCFQCTIS